VAGCVSPEVKAVVHDQALAQKEMVARLNAGQLTQHDLEVNLTTNAGLWDALDALLCGTDKEARQ
jgi:hypothetical protein